MRKVIGADKLMYVSFNFACVLYVYTLSQFPCACFPPREVLLKPPTLYLALTPHTYTHTYTVASFLTTITDAPAPSL